ncbi:KR domain-containing protein [Kibdelosporangium aridum]|uniref:KR domain-containing protein n=1 Tax=Kibdelosporangium aridum TaxID=2030 RepID=A0A428ZQX4_KIBAR|nr:SDR family oxidoreductase [Kibdelosporangium aridum]RSM90469.1 KR domain-containing protein [Kibdelosporangium aridum]
MTTLANKVALVTGSARGIGRAIADRYASLGAKVVINYSSNATRALEAVAAIEQTGAEAIAVQADVAKVSDLERLFATTLDRFGQLDVVVANAGVELVDQPVLDYTEADFDRLFAINAKGGLFTLQLAARHVADNGRIIYIGTSNTACALPGHALYGASKAAVQFAVEVLAKEIGHRGVTVNSILPTATEGAGVFTGTVREEIAEYVRTLRPIQRMGTTEDVANAAEYLAGDLATFISGQHLLITGGAPA